MNILLSFHYYRDTDLDALIGKFATPPRVFADSGAFSAMSVGADVQLHEYVAWLNRWQHLFTTYVNLDVIGDPVATWENQQRMEDQGLHPVPVFHGGSPWEFLERYLERGYPYIALGGMVGTAGVPALLRHATRCFRMAEGTGAVFHGFGMTKLPLLAALPWYSVDSSSWGASYRYGTVNLFDTDRCRWVRVRLGDHAAVYANAALLRAHGGKPEEFAQRGFGISGDKPPDQVRRERASLVRVSVVAWLRLQAWLQQHHGTVEGPTIYLADANGGWSDQKDLDVIAQMGPMVYLADAAAGTWDVVVEAMATTTPDQTCGELA